MDLPVQALRAAQGEALAARSAALDAQREMGRERRNAELAKASMEAQVRRTKLVGGSREA